MERAKDLGGRQGRWPVNEKHREMWAARRRRPLVQKEETKELRQTMDLRVTVTILTINMH